MDDDGIHDDCGCSTTVVVWWCSVVDVGKTKLPVSNVGGCALFVVVAVLIVQRIASCAVTIFHNPVPMFISCPRGCTKVCSLPKRGYVIAMGANWHCQSRTSL